MCTSLAVATDLLILLVRYLPLMHVASWMFWLCIFVFLHYCIEWYVCISSTVSMSTSYCHSPHLPLCSCYYCIIDLVCIIDLYHCIVLLCIYISPYSLQWVPVLLSLSSPTCLLVFIFSCRMDALFVYWLCLLLFVSRVLPLFLHWHLFLVICIDIYYLVICLLPQLLTAVAPALTLITSSKLRPCFAFYGGLCCFVGWLWCSLCCLVPYLYFFQIISPLFLYLLISFI